MLSYQHGYHAGNFADVIKHVALTHLLTYLTQKEKPLFFLDTHAGKGQYSLTHAQAKKNKEYISGILPLWQQRFKLSSEFSSYLTTISALNRDNQLLHYPGSPEIARQLLRPQDRMYLCEAHPKEFSALKKLYSHRKRLHLSQQDGWLALKSLLPPPEKRGLIFMDPSFELKQDYQAIPTLIRHAYEKFAQGVYCLWYPLTAHQSHLEMIHRLKNVGASNTLHIEFFLCKPNQTPQMHGMGLWIINPPHTLSQTLLPVLETCKRLFNFPHSFYLIRNEESSQTRSHG